MAVEILTEIADAVVRLETAVVGLGLSPWLFLAVLALACIDGVFPPVPSESVVIGVASLAVAGEGSALHLLPLALAAAAGAWAGDALAHTIGSRIPLDRLAVFRTATGRASLDRARRTLATRGTTVILTGRFVPVARVVINMTAGAVAYPRSRFLPLAGLAAGLWSGYSVAIGVGAGYLFRDSPGVAVAVGIVAGLLLGLATDKLLALVGARRRSTATDTDQKEDLPWTSPPCTPLPRTSPHTSPR